MPTAHSSPSLRSPPHQSIFAIFRFNRKFAKAIKTKFVKHTQTKMFIARALRKKLQEMARVYPVVTLTGPRQSGKSTLLRAAFPDYQYVSLEDLDVREFALHDPRGFLATYPRRVIVDEAQRVPQLFSYVQTHIDLAGDEGVYLLAGSQNFLLLDTVNQSLAGRTAVLKLLPFSRAELAAAGLHASNINEEIFRGSYPRLYDKAIAPVNYYPYYLQTYVERDVRQVKNIGDLGRFVRFIKLCAGRIGQLINFSSLANECGVAVSTAQAWMSVLEASYICFLLQPDSNNFSKRLVKTPKLYFYDTGLACSLLEIQNAGQLATHYLRGGLFENMVIAEFVKRGYAKGLDPQLTFWRDSTGHEVDLLCYEGGEVMAYEIKSSATYRQDFFDGLQHWAKLAKAPAERCAVFYAGERSLRTSSGSVIAWLK